MRTDAIAAAAAALPLLLGCASSSVVEDPSFAVALQPIPDSKCGGGLGLQSITVVNRGASPQPVRPQCTINTPGVELVEVPTVARLLAPGEQAIFVCALRDMGDPPDGRVVEAVARLIVRVGTVEQQHRVPVNCPR